MCDEPHPLLIKNMLNHCVESKFEEAYKVMSHLWKMGYSAVDIISNIFRVCKNLEMPEYLKLEFIKVSNNSFIRYWVCELVVTVHYNKFSIPIFLLAFGELRKINSLFYSCSVFCFVFFDRKLDTRTWELLKVYNHFFKCLDY